MMVKKNPVDDPTVVAFRISSRDVLCCLFFILFWILPVTYTGLTQKKLTFLPRSITYFQSISNLFTHSVPVWPMPYIQIQHKGSETWVTLPEEDYFRLKTFGFRTRFFEALYLATNIPEYDRRSAGVQSELAQWVARRYARLHPGSPPIDQVRFVAALYRVDRHTLPQGHWLPPDFAMFSAGSTYVISTHDVTIVED